MSRRSFRSRRSAAVITLAALVGVSLVACGDDNDVPQSTPATLTLVAYDSFPLEATAINDALAEFTNNSGIDVEILHAGDTGTMVAKAILTSGNPEGDVIFGVDNTFLSAAQNGDIYDGQPVAIDTGDVCINYDKEWFSSPAANGLRPPSSLADLATPEYAPLLVVQNPSTSSVGLAFLLATIAEYGDDGWQSYWESLNANGVEVVDSWDVAYFESFTRSGGDRPLVVSYGTSPPYEVIFADPPRTDAPTGVVGDTCFRQTEYAGVLRGTRHRDAAQQLVDFMADRAFQEALPLSLFVYPTLTSVELPAEFTTYSVIPEQPLTIDAERIDTNRQRWQDEWTAIFRS